MHSMPSLKAYRPYKVPSEPEPAQQGGVHVRIVPAGSCRLTSDDGPVLMRRIKFGRG